MWLKNTELSVLLKAPSKDQILVSHTANLTARTGLTLKHTPGANGNYLQFPKKD